MNPQLNQSLSPDVIHRHTVLIELRDEEHQVAGFEALCDMQDWHCWYRDYFKDQL